MSVNRDMPILIVDDHPAMIKMVKHAFGQLGFRNVDEAADGADAVRKMEQTSYALVMSDFKMQPMDGMALLKILRNDERTSDIPFIMMTGEGSTATLMDARNFGVSQYIVKPFNVKTLRSKLEAVFGSLDSVA